MIDHPRWTSIEDLPGEIWKEVPENYGKLSISDLGRLRVNAGTFPAGKKRKEVVDPYLKKLRLNRYGYLDVGARKNDKNTIVKIHRMVADSFCNKTMLGQHQVHHKNSVRHDNRASNLEWATPKHNMQEAVKSGSLAGYKLRLDYWHSWHRAEFIRQKCSEGFSQWSVAQMFCVSECYVNNIVNLRVCKTQPKKTQMAPNQVNGGKGVYTKVGAAQLEMDLGALF